MLKLLQKVLPISFLIGLSIFLSNKRPLNQKMIMTTLFLCISFMLIEHFYKDDIKEGLWVPFMNNKKKEEFDDEEEDIEDKEDSEDSEDKQESKDKDDKCECDGRDDELPMDVGGRDRQMAGPIGLETGSKQLLNKLSKGGININFYINKDGEISTESSKKQDNNNCKFIDESGFKPYWNKSIVEEIRKSDSGKKMLDEVDNKYKELTGKSKLLEEDIIKCYPSYGNSYRNDNNYTNNQNNLNNNIGGVEMGPSDDLTYDNTNDGSTNIFLVGNNNTTNPPIDLDLGDVPSGNNQETSSDSIDNFTNNTTCEKKEVERALECNLKDLRFEISKEIESYYYSVLQNMITTCNLPTGYTKEDIWAGYKKNFSYIADRAMIEFAKLERNWKNKSYTKWRKHLESLKVRFNRGYPIFGTDFFIPWKIIEKYEICLGDKTNNMGGFPLEMEKNYIA